MVAAVAAAAVDVDAETDVDVHYPNNGYHCCAICHGGPACNSRLWVVIAFLDDVVVAFAVAAAVDA